MIALIDTGIANTASVAAALQRLGAPVTRTDRAEDVASAAFVVLPGVGSFAAGMAALERAGLVRVLRERLVAGRPTLAICLGMQLLARSSQEAPGTPGLGVVLEDVRQLDTPTLPHMGWAPIEGRGRLVSGGAAYFAHSYALTQAPAGWTTSWSGPFVASIERGRVLACQFHPELSGRWGLELLGRWLEDRPATAAAASPVGPRIIPCLDVRDGRVVKGVRFQGLRDAGDPVEQATTYARQGADELVILDVSATPDGRATAAETVRAVRQVLPIPLTVGGGVRSVSDAERLLRAGADKVAVNTAAVQDPSLLTRLADAFGRQCVVLALDAARVGSGWQVVTRSGTHLTGIDAVTWARDAAAAGAGEILLTSWDRDGTGHGYDTALLRAVSGAVRVPVIASGGARTAAHLAAALRHGADAVLAATIFHDGLTSVGSIKTALRDGEGLEVRL